MVRSDGASRWDRWTPASRWPALAAVACLLVAAFVLVTAPRRFDEAAGPWPCDRSDSSLVRSAATGDLDLLQRELAGGQSPDRPDAWGRTALSCAAMFDRPEAARLLLANGADPNRMAVDRTSPLAAAARSGDRHLIEVLLAAGAGGRGSPAVTEAADQPSAAPPPRRATRPSRTRRHPHTTTSAESNAPISTPSSLGRWPPVTSRPRADCSTRVQTPATGRPGSARWCSPPGRASRRSFGCCWRGGSTRTSSRARRVGPPPPVAPVRQRRPMPRRAPRCPDQPRPRRRLPLALTDRRRRRPTR